VQRALEEEEYDDYDYDDDWIDDSGVVGGIQGGAGPEANMDEAIRLSLLELDRKGRSASQPIAVDDLDLAEEIAKQSRKYRKRLARCILCLNSTGQI
jgi:hypothetical protein